MNMEPGAFLAFPPDFTWGTATSAYQIEGAWNVDGRGVSIWDTFSHQPGKTYQSHNGDTAADHYHRWEADIDIMAQLGLKAYRFSIAWPRIFPEGIGKVNKIGLDFYDRLVDSLLKKGIKPFPTLYHWDLPQALQDRGGWPNRDTAYYFADYAKIVSARLSDRVTHWITHNEPLVVATLGHFLGVMAPGIQDPVAAAHTTHHLLLSHGLAVKALRSQSNRPIQVGITLNLTPMHPASDSEADREAALRYDGLSNRLFLDPILKGSYPEDIQNLLAMVLPEVLPGDMEAISAPIDFLGINYYSRSVVRHDPIIPIVQASTLNPEGSEYSMMWEVYPPGMYELLVRVHKEYAPPQIYVTENGAPFPDDLDFDGRIRDYRRIRFLRDHFIHTHRAIQEGVPVKGYFVWSLLDNFEWALGYRMRFGLVHVDFEDLRRTVKESGKWYAEVIRNNGVDPEERSYFLPF
jgi:beta-glucosidase